MKKPDPVNTVRNKDEFSSGLMESYGKWMGGDCFQTPNTIKEAPFDGMDPQSNGAEIEDTTKRKKGATKKGAYVGQEAAPKNEEVLEREEYEIDGETFVIEKKKGLDGKACWKGYKLAGTKKKGGKTVDNCVKAGDEIVHDGEELEEGMKQARANVGASTCWDGYKAKGTKKKGGKEVPNCVKEEELSEKKLDPVGKEDKDIDNDGDHDKSDKYLLARRKKVSKIIAMKKK